MHRYGINFGTQLPVGSELRDTKDRFDGTFCTGRATIDHADRQRGGADRVVRRLLRHALCRTGAAGGGDNHVRPASRGDCSGRLPRGLPTVATARCAGGMVASSCREQVDVLDTATDDGAATGSAAGGAGLAEWRVRGATPHRRPATP